MMRSTKAFIALGTGIATVAGAGVAYASFNASGVSTGSSGGHSVAKQALVVSVTAPTGLYPTQASAGNLSISVANPNPYNVTVTGASVTAVASATQGCSPSLSDFTFGTTSITTATAARLSGTPAAATIPISAVANTLPDTCADADISFTVSVSGASN